MMKKSVLTRRLILCMIIFILPYTKSFTQEVSPTSQKQLEAVKKTFNLIVQSNAYSESLSEANHNVLPIGLKRVIDNMEVTIAVDKVIFHAEYSELSVYAKAVIPQGDSNDRVLFFGANGIKLSYNGSIIGDATLTLLQDIEIPFNNGNMSLLLKGSYSSTSSRAESSTYMAIDCKGFKELGIDAEVRFPTTLIKKADGGSSSPRDVSEVVSASFQTVISSWNDMLVNITLPSFSITGLDGFIFHLQNTVLDFSDSRNDPTVQFPSGYEQKYMIPGATTFWRGVYAESLEITLPSQFSNTFNEPTKFSSQRLIIDDNGISGLFTAENILSFQQGNANGWNFSVNGFKLELEANKLIAAGFDGEIGLPFKGENTRLGYHALIQENNEYLMQVNPMKDLDFSIFNAKATILPNSYLTLHVINHQFRPEALLHGNMQIIPLDDVPVPASIPSVEFRSLLLKTEAPYISVEYLGSKGKASVGHFPISIYDMSLQAKDSRVELTSGIEVTLADGMFSGKTKLTFVASLEKQDNRNKWKFDGAILNDIAVDANIAETIQLKGEVSWRRKDLVYGDGFSGDLTIGLTKPFKLEVGMRGCFGRKDDFGYWFVDGETLLPHGIPVAGVLTIKGFSGAVTHRMLASSNRSTQVGSAFSSIQYVPDSGSGLGLKAAVLLNIGSIAHGEACFDIAFSNKGGLNYIGFYGYAEFSGKAGGLGGLTGKYAAIVEKESKYTSTISSLKQLEPNKAAEIVSPIPAEMKYGVMGSIGIQYDFRNHSLHAQTELMINALGGFIQGTGTGNKAGWGVLHFDPSEWYIHLGAPDNRLGVKLSLGNILSIRSGSYLMSGSRIPAMPPPPIEVANLIGQDLSSLAMGRNMEALGLAKGFAFGSDFQVKTGDITFLMLYANFMTGLGFDIMLKDYGDAECRGRSGAIGLNGWYAQGQAYAYLQGELGVKINLWFIKMKFPIIKGGAATLMQAMLPNPAAFKGYLGVHINVLGLLKGSVRFKLSIGEECDLIIPGSSPLEMAMINDLSPQKDDTDISVFTIPQATFNAAIGQAFEAEDDKGVGTFRLQLKSFTITDNLGTEVQGTLKWNSHKDAVSFQAKEILPPHTTLKAEVNVTFEKLEDGTWKTVYTSGQESVELKECTFTTGTAPETIPMENVIYSYPVVDQQYYLPEESTNGFVQLQFGQKYLFEKGFDYKLIFTGEDKNPVASTFQYNESDNRLEFITPNHLKKQQKYTLKIAYTPQEDQYSDTAGNTSEGKQLWESEDGKLTADGKNAIAAINTSLNKEILSYHFSTSKYRSFKQKIGAVKTQNGAVAEDAGVSVRLLYKVQADEVFDAAEVTGVDKSEGKPLIHPVATLEEPFFTDIVFPMTYNDYPVEGLHLSNREEAVIGVPPHKSIFVYSPYLDILTNGAKPAQFFFPYSYESAIVSELDFRDLQSSVVSNRSLINKEVYNRFATGRLPFMKKGKYKVVLKYVLPNGKETSAYDFKFNNFLLLNE